MSAGDCSASQRATWENQEPLPQSPGRTRHHLPPPRREPEDKGCEGPTEMSSTWPGGQPTSGE